MKHILITGGSRRLGLSLTKHFIELGWQVTVLTRSISEELAVLDYKQLTVLKIDYTDLGGIAEQCKHLLSTPLHALVHNASIFINDEKIGESGFEQLFNIHMKLPAFLNNLFADALKQTGDANIVHMSDLYVDNPQESFSYYCASKAGLENLSKSFAKKFAPEVRVNTIQPGALKFLPDHSEVAKQAVLDGSLIPIEAGFEPIVQTIDYLINNPFVTGTSIKVDGGRSLCR